MKFILPLLICSMILFWVGFHNMDSAFNFKRMNLMMEETGYQIINDQGLIFSQTIEEGYIRGFIMIIIGYFISIIIILYQ